MKKPLLLSFAIALGLGITAQTVLFEDNFDSYTAGMGIVAQNSEWSYWTSGTDTDGMVDDATAFSGSNSGLVDGTGTDLVLPIGPYNASGKYDIKFKMNIEEGAGGYFNVMHSWTATSTAYEWAVDVFFSSTGEVTWTVGAEAGGASQVTPGEWFDIQITADLDNDLGKLYLNGELLASWQWSLNNADGTAGLNQLAAVDFYGTNDTTSGSGTYWIDDVQVIESTGVGVAQPTAMNTPSFFPNPANDSFQLSNMENWVGGSFQVMDLTGKVVMSKNITSTMLQNKVDVSVLNDGIYMVKFAYNGKEFTRKLIVRH